MAMYYMLPDPPQLYRFTGFTRLTGLTTFTGLHTGLTRLHTGLTRPRLTQKLTGLTTHWTNPSLLPPSKYLSLFTMA